MAPATSAASVRERLDRLFKQRIVIFDGSTGVLLQKQGLTEEDWRGEGVCAHPHLLKKHVATLHLSRPDVVSRHHPANPQARAALLAADPVTPTPVSPAGPA